MGITTIKGNIAESVVLAECIKHGLKVSIPFSQDCDYDLVIEVNNELLKIQCKYTESDGKSLKVICQSQSDWVHKSYTKDMVDYIIVYDKTSNKCYYIPSVLLGEGRASINLRLIPAANGQNHLYYQASDFMFFDTYLTTDKEKCYCPYCNSEFKSWKSVRAHTAHCKETNREYFVDLVEGPIHYTEFLKKDYKQIYPRLGSKIQDIKSSFRKRGINISS